MQDVTFENILALLKSRPDSSFRNKALLFLLGIVLTPITLAGAMLGFIRGYHRLQAQKMGPDLANITRLMWALMTVVAILVWVVIGVFLWLVSHVFSSIFASLGTAFLISNVGGTVFVFSAYFAWQFLANKRFNESRRYGTARFGNELDALDMLTGQGLYIGGNYSFNGMGHLMTIGATRSGKGTSLIIPALLDCAAYSGSLVIIDPKGENAAITARYQREKGQNVLLLDPWGVESTDAASYNPMDILKAGDDLGDDATMLAEMIVPIDPGNRDPFWAERARSLITGLILYIHETGGDLTTLWRYLRLTPDEWENLIGRMQSSDNEIISSVANEIEGVMESEKTFASIMASAQQATDFLKSPALQRSLSKSNFKMSDLTGGKMTIYVIIPADKLKSHYQWLRLVVTSAMREVIRNYNKKVTFILDEFPSLGQLKEVSEFGLAAAAGYNLSLWMILQSLPQLQNLYRDNWQNFIANTSVKQYIGISDNFTADYISKSMGNTTFVTEERGQDNKMIINASGRALMTPDEIRVASDESIILQVERRPTMLVPKAPYLANEELKARADANPYHVKKGETA